MLLEGRFASRPAYLELEPTILEEVAEAASKDRDDDPRASLVTAVAGTLGLKRVTAPFSFHLEAVDRWEFEGRNGVPPFVALLAVLVLAAQDMISDDQHAAHNYYGRLEQLLGLPEPRWTQVRRHFADTVPLWRRFNDWLEDWEGERGLPTATVRDRRVYIGFPLSQALVRAADRARLHEAFVEYSLVPGRRIAVSEMSAYLGDWLTHHAAGSRLARMWEGGIEARERIVDIALGELAAWTGSSDSSTNVAHGPTVAAHARATQLRWAAELRDGPLPILDLYLTAPSNPTINGLYEVMSSSDESAKSAVNGCAGELRLEPLPDGTQSSLEPWKQIGVASLLAGALRIRRQGEPATELVHSPDALIVLALDPSDGWYRDVSRAQLLEPCIVLAHNERATLVDGHLRLYARPGYRRLDPQDLEGLPEGWVAFLDITLVRAADEQQHPKLKSLCSAPANAISLSGGLRLGGSTWHVDAPPEVLITLEQNSELTLKADCRRKLGDDAKSVEFGAHSSPAAVPLSRAGLEAGDYDLLVTDAREQLMAHAGIRLRSADHPRPSRQLLQNIAHGLADGRGLITATEMTTAKVGVTGALITGDPTGTSPTRLSLPITPLLTAADDGGKARARSSRPDRGAHRHACVAGVHHWMCDPGFMGETTRTLKRMECRECQRELWTINRGRLPRGRFTRAFTSPRPLAPPTMAPPDRTHQGIKPKLDTLLDAVSYARFGSWEAFKQMAAGLDEDPMAAWSAARTLSALGHIDLRFSPREFRLTAWQIAPTTLVECSDGSWVLAGARSDRTVDRLDELAEGRLAYEEGCTLTVLRLPPMSESRAANLASALPSSLGGMARAVPRFSERLAAALPPLASILPTLQVARLPSQGHEFFDLHSGRWEPAAEPAQPGAYRMELHGRLYGVADGALARTGEMRVVDVLTAKHLAAVDAGTSLLGYDEDGDNLMTPLGAELPGLLHRVAALASGTPPELQRKSGLTLYRGVPERIASHLQRCLGISG